MSLKSLASEGDVIPNLQMETLRLNEMVTCFEGIQLGKLQWGWKPRPKRLQAGQYNLKSCRQFKAALKPKLVPGKEALSPQGHPAQPNGQKGALGRQRPPARPGPALCPPACCSSRNPRLCHDVTDIHLWLRKPKPPCACPARFPGHRVGEGKQGAPFSYPQSQSRTHIALGVFIYSPVTCYALWSKVKVGNCSVVTDSL